MNLLLSIILPICLLLFLIVYSYKKRKRSYGNKKGLCQTILNLSCTSNSETFSKHLILLFKQISVFPGKLLGVEKKITSIFQKSRVTKFQQYYLKDMKSD